MLLSLSSVSDAGVGHQHLQPLPPQMQLICNINRLLLKMAGCELAGNWKRVQLKVRFELFSTLWNYLFTQLEFYAAAAAALRFLQFSQRTKHDLLGAGRA